MTKSTSRALAMAGALLAVALTRTAWADSAEEKERRMQCAKQLCGIIVSRNANGPDLNCDLAKSWEKDEIQRNADSKHISWGLGSARCSMKLSVSRASIVAALSAPDAKFRVSPQTIACEIGTEKYPISATVAPELSLKHGNVTAASLHMEHIHGAPLIKGVVWTAAVLERHFGILEGDMVREVNRFMQHECPKMLSAK